MFSKDVCMFCGGLSCVVGFMLLVVDVFFFGIFV